MERIVAINHARNWIDAWNSHKVEAIVSFYADDIEFIAPTVIKRWGKPDATLRGIDALREHVQRGLELAPGLRFDLEHIFTGPTGYSVLYHRDNGNRVVDVVELNEEGKARRVLAMYAFEQD